MHSHNCDMPCKGNREETCGGRDAITVYERDGPGGSGGTVGHLGCYRDDGKNRIMNLGSTKSDSITPKVDIRPAFFTLSAAILVGHEESRSP